MSAPEEFRKYADTCVRMAKDATAPDDRSRLLDMAAVWRRLAEEAERFDQLVRDVDRAFDPPSPQDATSDPSHRRSH